MELEETPGLVCKNTKDQKVTGSQDDGLVELGSIWFGVQKHEKIKIVTGSRDDKVEAAAHLGIMEVDGQIQKS